MKVIARKRFGQNFLQDSSIIQAIINAIHPQVGQNLVEIGPGRGALTFPVLKKMDKLTAIEIDRDLIAYLNTTKNLHLIEADALAFDYHQLREANASKKIRLYGNLPYNISTPLLLHLLSFIDIIEDCHFMVQKEVAERITAIPNCKNYGRLSVMIQYFCQAEILFSVDPEAFYPKPKVDSSIIRLIPYMVSPYQTVTLELLEYTVKQAFAHRRKTLRNNFKGILSEANWATLNIDPILRPENLSIETFVRIARFML